MDVAVGRDLPNEGDTPSRDGQRLGRDGEVMRELLQFLPTPMLVGRQAAQPPLGMLGVDGCLQACQFVFECAGPREVPLQ